MVSVASTRSSVDLPLPFSPTIATISPSRTRQIDGVDGALERPCSAHGAATDVHVARAGTTSPAWSLRRRCRRHLPWTPISPAHVAVLFWTNKRTVPAGPHDPVSRATRCSDDSRSDPGRADSTLERGEPDSDAAALPSQKRRSSARINERARHGRCCAPRVSNAARRQPVAVRARHALSSRHVPRLHEATGDPRRALRPLRAVRQGRAQRVPLPALSGAWRRRAHGQGRRAVAPRAAPEVARAARARTRVICHQDATWDSTSSR